MSITLKAVASAILAGTFATISAALPAKAEMTNKQIAVKLLEQGIIKGDKTFINKYVAQNYIQHNPIAPDGRKGLLDFVDYLKTLPTPATVKPIRVFTQGNLVVIHSNYNLADNKAVFDLFRFKDGKIVEHWDGIQDMPGKKSVSGNTMFDGPTQATNLDKTAANKKLVLSLLNDVFIKGNLDNITNYIGKTYIQHNPDIGNGLDGLGKYLAQLKAANITFTYSKVHNVVAQGNFVFTQSAGKISGKPFAFYDLFRVENNKIVEHWDVIQTIPAKMAHTNGMF